LRTTAFLVAAVVVAMAGCSDAPAPAPAPSGAPSLGGSASSTSTSPEAPSAPEAVPVAVAFERSGKTWTTACIVAQPAYAECRSVVEGSDLTEFFPDGERVVALRAELTWETGNDEMGIGIVFEENGTLVGSPDLYASGPSPLAVDFDLSALLGKRVGFHVASYVTAGTGQAHADVSPGQDWRLAGELTVLRST
jgi:hypothetical protein